MASVGMRRSVLTAVMATAATIASPLVGASTAHAATNPALTSSFPASGASMVTSQTVTATYDQQIAESSTQTPFTVWLISNGTRQNTILGGTGLVSSQGPLGKNDTITFSPFTPMSAGHEYEAVIHVDGVDSKGVDNPAAATTTDFFFWVVDKTAPSVTAPANINNTNASAVPFTGHAAPGLIVTVTLSQSNAPVATGTTTVSTSCATAPSCPFTAAVNASNLPDGTYTWTASAADANGTATNATPGASITKDTSAPCSVPNSCQPSMSYSSSDNTVTVTAPAPNNAGITKWYVTVADQDGHAIGPFTYPVNNTNLNASGLDVSGLDDGTLTATVVAEDGAGNRSTPQTASATKDTGLHVLFANSYFTNNNGNVTLPNAEKAATKSPTSLTLVFDQPIESSFSDSTSNKTYDTTVCVVDRFSNCAVYSTDGQVSSDGRSLTVPVTSQLADTASPYTIQVVAFSKNLCPNRTPSNSTPPNNTWSCETTSGPITNPSNITAYTLQDNGTNAPFTFDTTPPAAPTVTVPNVDATTITSVPISGDAEPGSRVDVTVSSSGGGSQLVANPGGTTADGAGHYAFNANLSSLPDGALTVLATATDAAGNKSAAGSASPALQARPTAPQSAAAAPGDRAAVVSWAPPASTGGHPITGYTVTYADTTAGTARQSVNAGTGTSAVLTGLINGHSYSVTVFASNDRGAGPSAATSVTPRGSSRMTLSRSHATITDGQSVTLFGQLTQAATGNGIGSAPVTVTSTYDNGSHGPTYHLTTDEFGYWQFTAKPAKNVRYLATYAGSTASGPVSTGTRVAVRVAIKITKVSAASKSHTSAVTFSGTVAPNERGRTVYLYEQKGKKLIKLGSVHLSSKSTWTYRRAFGRGTHYVFARFLSQNGSTGNSSSKVKFSRT